MKQSNAEKVKESYIETICSFYRDLLKSNFKQIGRIELTEIETLLCIREEEQKTA